MAAQRAGVKKVLIPTDNEDDLRDVPKEILDQLEIVSVKSVDEVLDHCGISGDEAELRAI